MNRYFVIFFIVVFIGSIVGLSILSRQAADQAHDNSKQNSQVETSIPSQSSSEAKEAAIRNAKSYTPPSDTICTMALTPAVHNETGATYTFPSGCIPEGWSPQ